MKSAEHLIETLKHVSYQSPAVVIYESYNAFQCSARCNRMVTNEKDDTSSLFGEGFMRQTIRREEEGMYVIDKARYVELRTRGLNIKNVLRLQRIVH